MAKRVWSWEIPEFRNTDISKITIKFPRIASKHKSMPDATEVVLDDVTAKSWLYYSPHRQLGHTPLMQDPTTPSRGKWPVSPKSWLVCVCGRPLWEVCNTFFKITKWSASINGTSANLIANFWISVEDLLYGLMLPSGNDAALVLAENMGAVLYFDRMGEHEMVEGYWLPM